MGLKGYIGTILHVDLSNSGAYVESLNEEWLHKFIGGSGLGARFLYEMTDEKKDPLSPENLHISITGPFTGTRVSLLGRHAVGARSPLTGIFGESDVERVTL